MKNTKFYISISLGEVKDGKYVPTDGFVMEEESWKLNYEFLKFKIDSFIQKTKDKQNEANK